jgi:hypothetical protein
MAAVTVQIEWPEGLQALPANARAWVTVEDVTRADESAVVLAESIVDDLDAARAPRAVVEVGEFDPEADLSVRVRVAGAGRVGRDVEVGDLVSTQSHPVLTRGHGDAVVVPVRVVGS